VIAGKSVVAFRREDEGEIPSAKVFGLVPTYEEKPRRRLGELMKWQGRQENQQVVFLSNGGEAVRRVPEYLHPFSEHLIDGFPITMRVKVLPQPTKALQEERPETGADVWKRLNRVKHLLWHGNTEEALERMSVLLAELSLIQARSAAAKKVADSLSGAGDVHPQQPRVHCELRRAPAPISAFRRTCARGPPSARRREPPEWRRFCLSFW